LYRHGLEDIIATASHVDHSTCITQNRSAQ
jgi:hypothetical protein